MGWRVALAVPPRDIEMLFSTIAFEPLLHHSRCGGADLVLRFEVDSLRLQGAMIDARIDIERDEPFVDMLRPGLAPMGQQFGAVPITDLGDRKSKRLNSSH